MVVSALDPAIERSSPPSLSVTAAAALGVLCFPESIAFLIAVFQISSGYSLKTLAFSAIPLSAILGSSLCFTFELFDWPIDHPSCHPLLQSAIVFNKCLQRRLCSDRVSSKAGQRSLTCSLPGKPQAGWILVILWSWGFGSTASLFCPAAIAWGCFSWPITGCWSLGTQGERSMESKLVISLFLLVPRQCPAGY